MIDSSRDFNMSSFLSMESSNFLNLLISSDRPFSIFDSNCCVSAFSVLNARKCLRLTLRFSIFVIDSEKVSLARLSLPSNVSVLMSNDVLREDSEFLQILHMYRALGSCVLITATGSESQRERFHLGDSGSTLEGVLDSSLFSMLVSQLVVPDLVRILLNSLFRE